jgi:hypothetical protein
MWQNKVKKAIFTLNIDNYAPEITELTYPLLRAYASKIGAEFVVINRRKFLDYPVVYEKLQIYELAQEMGNEWNIYIDSDALIHPDLMDFTVILPRDTVAHHGSDFASIRWRYDRFFRRDGRHIGSGNWFAIASDWCVELWKPLDDLTIAEAVDNIFPTVDERVSGVINKDHLIDDYTLSRNIAKYGLKFASIRKLLDSLGFPGGGPFFWHQYLLPIEQKVIGIKKQLADWRLT